MRALVLGAGGMLGHELIRTAPPGVQVTGHGRAETDVTDLVQLEAAVGQIVPDVILNAAAYTSVDGAEAEPDRARAVNAEAPGLIGRAARSAMVVHYSTDYVFDGAVGRPYRETDLIGPLSVYGRTKLLGELALQQSGARHLIIRTSWLFGPAGASFPRTMWERARAGEKTRVVCDQTGRPTYAADLARLTWRLLAHTYHPTAFPPFRLLHAANSGAATWYDVARRVFRAAGVEHLVEPRTTAECATPAGRPAWSVLDTERLDALIGPMPSWEDALDRFLTGLAGERS